MAILTELRDPRVKNVTVVGVEVAPDMREAKVLVSIMGNESQQKTTLRGLKNAAGFLQSKIAERIDTRYTPRLTFVADDGVKKSMAVAQILEQIAHENRKNKPTPESEPASELTEETDGEEKDQENDEVVDELDDEVVDQLADHIDAPSDVPSRSDSSLPGVD